MKYKVYLLFTILFMVSCSGNKNKDVTSSNKKLPEPVKTTINSDVDASSFLPGDYTQFIYLKSGDIAYQKFIDNNFYQNLKNNYLFLDFKYNFSENIDMFFTKFNFDFKSIFQYIEEDIAFGTTKNSFFLITSMSFKSKILTSLLNIAPDNIVKETEINDHKIYYIDKDTSSIYYTVVNDYILFADSKETLSAQLDAAIKKINIDRDYNNILKNSELILCKKINNNKNPFDIFPEFKEVEINYNTETEKISYKAIPLDGSQILNETDITDPFKTLQLLSPDLSMVLYNSDYNFKEIIKSMANSDNKERVNKNTDLIDLSQKGTYFIAGDVSNIISDGSPELGIIINVLNGLNLEDSVLELTSDLLGVNWVESEIIESSKFYTAEISNFYLIISNSNIALFTNEILAKDYLNRITNKGMSLYDKHFESVKSSNNPYSFICYNPDNIKNSLEPLIKRYLFSNINMDDYEYNRSFGGLLTYFSGLKPGYMDLETNENGEMFYGSIKKVP